MSGFGPLMVFLESTILSPKERTMLRDPRVGGVILFDRNYATKEQLKSLTHEIKSIAEELVIAADHEGGRVQRLKREGFTHLPPARLFGHYYDASPQKACTLIRATGALAAYELNQVGIDLSLAPVLDIDAGASSVIGNRALHSDPETVALLGEAHICGLHDQNMLGVGKHYPGHGSVEADTHLGKVRDNRTLVKMQGYDMLPYQRLIQNDSLDAVMMAHVIYPQVDELPASLSRIWMTESFEKTGFNGLVLSDDMNMKGIDAKNLSARAVFEAGCHIMLVCDNKALLTDVMRELDDDAVLENYRNRFRQRWLRRQAAVSKTEKQQYDFNQTKTELSELVKHYS